MITLYLGRVQIKRYRCLYDVDLSLRTNTILIGENNAGKTAFLDALRQALKRNPSFNEYDFYMETNIDSPQQSEGIVIILTFQELHSGDWDEAIIQRFTDIVQPGECDTLCIMYRVTAQYNDATRSFETSIDFLNSDGDPLPARTRGLQADFLGYVPLYYMQALRDTKESFSNNSFMWGKFLKRATVNEQDLAELQSRIKSLNDDIIRQDEDLSALVEALARLQNITDVSSTDTIGINALPLKSWDLLSKAQLTIKGGDSLDLPIERLGQGTQSTSIILLYIAYIEILMRAVQNENAEAILTLEEPEAHLHPQAVRSIEKELKKASFQKLISTHSPYFLQNASVFDVRLFKRIDGKSIVYSVKKQHEYHIEPPPESITNTSTD